MTTPIIALAWLIAIGACASLEFVVRRRVNETKNCGGVGR